MSTSSKERRAALSLVEVVVCLGLLGLLTTVWMGSLLGLVSHRRALETESVAAGLTTGFLDEALTRKTRRVAELGPRRITDFRWVRGALKIGTGEEANAFRVHRTAADGRSGKVTVRVLFGGGGRSHGTAGEVRTRS